MARRSALRVSRPHGAQNTTPCLCRDDGFAGDDDADDDDDDDDGFAGDDDDDDDDNDDG